MSAQFTPAPWHTVITIGGLIGHERMQWAVLDESEKHRICIGACDRPEAFDTVEANANLISLAPAMYQFGEKAKELLSDMLQESEWENPWDRAQMLIEEWKEIAKKARGEG